LESSIWLNPRNIVVERDLSGNKCRTKIYNLSGSGCNHRLFEGDVTEREYAIHAIANFPQKNS
jgi:hypothetical protein